MPVSPEIEKQIQESIAALTKMFREGVLPPEAYHKALVCLAYEYAVGGEVVRALALLQSVPLEYYQTHQRRQMLEDAQYAQVAYVLAKTILEAGYVNLGPNLAPTMPPAKA